MSRGAGQRPGITRRCSAQACKSSNGIPWSRQTSLRLKGLQVGKVRGAFSSRARPRAAMSGQVGMARVGQAPMQGGAMAGEVKAQVVARGGGTWKSRSEKGDRLSTDNGSSGGERLVEVACAKKCKGIHGNQQEGTVGHKKGLRVGRSVRASVYKCVWGYRSSSL